MLRRHVPGNNIKVLTIKRNRAGQWFAVFCCEVEMSQPSHTGPTIGLDQGLKSLMVGSDGMIIEPPRFLGKSEKHLAKEQKGDEKFGLGDREYRCSCCGFIIDRDLNASMNIHGDGLARIYACGDDVRPSLSKAVVAEPGTTRFEKKG